MRSPTQASVATSSIGCGPVADVLSEAQRIVSSADADNVPLWLAGGTAILLHGRARARVGDRVRWYELPEEVGEAVSVDPSSALNDRALA